MTKDKDQKIEISDSSESPEKKKPIDQWSGEEKEKELENYVYGKDNQYFAVDGSGRFFCVDSFPEAKKGQEKKVKIFCNWDEHGGIRKGHTQTLTVDKFLVQCSLDEFELRQGTQEKSKEEIDKGIEEQRKKFGGKGTHWEISGQEREISGYGYDKDSGGYYVTFKVMRGANSNACLISDLETHLRQGKAKRLTKNPVEDSGAKEKSEEEKKKGLKLTYQRYIKEEDRWEDVPDYEERDPVRAGAAHNLYKLGQSKDMDLGHLAPEGKMTVTKDGDGKVVRMDLDYDPSKMTPEEKAEFNRAEDERFSELTRELWDLLITHGYAEEQEDGTYRMTKEASDLDGESCLALCRMAGLVSAKVKYVPQGEGEDDESLTMDTSKDKEGRGSIGGIVGLEGGKRVVIDHHSEDSGRDTSATKYTYEFLIANGRLKKEAYLDKYVEFVTQEDNKTYFESDLKKNFPNSWQSMRGLCHYIDPATIIDFFKRGEESGKPFDPDAPLPEDFIKNYTYTAKDPNNPIDKLNNGKTLEQLRELVKDRIERSLESISRLEKGGFVFDTGSKNYGRILIDPGFARKDKVIKSVPMGHDAVRASGFGGYLVWMPQQNGFVLYTTRSLRDPANLDREIRFSQGFNVRGNMWMKPKNKELIQVTLEEIVSKLSRKRTKISPELRKALAKKGLASSLVDLPSGSELPGGAENGKDKSKEKKTKEVSPERWKWLNFAIDSYGKSGKDYKKLLDEEKVFTVAGNTPEEKEKNKRVKLEKFIRNGLDDYNNDLKKEEKFDEEELLYMSERIMENIYS